MKTYLYLAATLLFIISCSNPDQEQVDSSETLETSVKLSPDQIKTAGIQTGLPAMRPASDEILLHGFLEAPPGNLISIFAPYGGYIRQTTLLQGMHLHKGDVVATVEHQAYLNLQEEFLSVKNQLQLAELELQRQEQLFSGEASPEKKLQEAKSVVEGLKIRKSALTEKLSFCGIDAEGLKTENLSRTITLFSPVNAFVKSVNANRGKYVDAKEVIAELIDTEHLHVELKAYEKDLQRLHKGSLIRFSTSGNPEKFHSAHVYLVGRSVDQDRSITVHGHLDDETESFTPGESVTAWISPESDSCLSIESGAVFGHEGHTYIIEETSQGVYELREVEVVGSGSDYTSIRANGLNKESRIVIKGTMSLRGMLFKEEEAGHAH